MQPAGRRVFLIAGGSTLAGLMASLPASAPAAGLADLLSTLGPAPAAPAGRVDVNAWVEGTGAASELVISLVPVGDVRLVADPGVTVEPVASGNVAWRTPGPVRLAQEGVHYFATPPTLRVPFAAKEGKVGARVEYAYCIIDQKCLFGEASVSVPVAAGS